MSTTIFFGMRDQPSYAAWLDAVDVDDLACAEPAPDGEGPWSETPLAFWRPRVSTRTTDTTLRDRIFEVRIQTLASHADVALAARIAARTAALVGARRVYAEGFGERAPDELAELYGTTWADDNARRGARVLAGMVRRNDLGGPIVLPGPIRDVWIGERVLSELDAARSPDQLHERLLETMLTVQWLDTRTAAIFESAEDGKTTFAAWGGDEIVFPRVDHAAIEDNADVLVIPSARVPELAGSRWRWIDECQGHIAAYEASEWQELIEAARALCARE